MEDRAETNQECTEPGKPNQGPVYLGVVGGLKRLYRFSSRHSDKLLVLTALMMVVSGFLALVYAPTVTNESFSAPHSQRIFYFHVPAAWVGMLAFTLVFAFSLLYLKTKELYWDQLAYASAEVGVLFCTLAIATGPLWGKAEWDQYWRNDPKLTVTFVLWMVYLAYLALRNSSGEDNAEIASILSIFGFILIPMTFFASRVIASSHPNVVGSSGGGLESEMVLTLVFSVFAFTVFFYYLFLKRFQLFRARTRLEELKTSLGVILNE